MIRSGIIAILVVISKYDSIINSNGVHNNTSKPTTGAQSNKDTINSFSPNGIGRHTNLPEHIPLKQHPGGDTNQRTNRDTNRIQNTQHLNIIVGIFRLLTLHQQKYTNNNNYNI